MTLRVARATSTAPWRPQRNRCLAGAREGVGGSVFGALVILVGIAAGATFAGLYNIAADVPHTQPTHYGNARSQSGRGTLLFRRMDEPTRIKGASEYAEMCSGCHLAPGMKRTQISQGLYPCAPELRRGSALTPAEQFWIIKHGVKMTAMPAWGVTHD